jgi:hypothetical protein
MPPQNRPWQDSPSASSEAPWSSNTENTSNQWSETVSTSTGMSGPALAAIIFFSVLFGSLLVVGGVVAYVMYKRRKRASKIIDMHSLDDLGVHHDEAFASDMVGFTPKPVEMVQIPVMEDQETLLNGQESAHSEGRRSFQMAKTRKLGLSSSKITRATTK